MFLVFGGSTKGSTNGMNNLADKTPGLNLIGGNTTIKGDIASSSNIRIEGKITGNIKCSDVVNIGKTGEVDGDVESKNIVVGGTVKGSLTASEKITLEKTAKVSGNISAKKLIIYEEAIFEGSCSMLDQSGDHNKSAIKKSLAAVIPEKQN